MMWRFVNLSISPGEERQGPKDNPLFCPPIGLLWHASRLRSPEVASFDGQFALIQIDEFAIVDWKKWSKGILKCPHHAREEMRT
jgi:hypothetical protein